MVIKKLSRKVKEYRYICLLKKDMKVKVNKKEFSINEGSCLFDLKFTKYKFDKYKKNGEINKYGYLGLYKISINKCVVIKFDILKKCPYCGWDEIKYSYTVNDDDRRLIDYYDCIDVSIFCSKCRTVVFNKYYNRLNKEIRNIDIDGFGDIVGDKRFTNLENKLYYYNVEKDVIKRYNKRIKDK